jgi:pimeloyl-ACP methyl ester carboxylesterase
MLQPPSPAARPNAILGVRKAGMPFSYRDENKELNDLTRQDASGSFVRLSDGFTHYEISNPEAQETVVLVHGFSVPYFIYDPTFAFLTQQGYRVVRYDLFGRGFSDRPEVRYNIDLFVRQLDELLHALRFAQPVTLVGLSTGGPITTVFTALHPEHVNKLVLIDPVGAKSLPYSWILKVATPPILGEKIIGLLRSDNLDNRIAARFFDRELIGHFQSRYVVQLQYKGFKRAILSTLRNNMLDSFLDSYERIGKMNKPVLLFWGRDDPTVPFEHSQPLRKAIPAIEFHAIELCGHTPHYEKPEEVNPILLEFLRK